MTAPPAGPLFTATLPGRHESGAPAARTRFDARSQIVEETDQVGNRTTYAD